MSRRPINSPFVITTEFGVRDSYALFGYHSGVDYAVPTGRQIFAPASGTLTNIISRTGGNMVVIYDGQFYHRMMHNSSFSRGNGWVNEGEQVALAGSTGLSTGPHCHWDININGSTARAFSDFRDPAKWLNGDYKVQGVNEMANREQVNSLYKGILMREGDPGGLNNYTGKDANVIVADMLRSQERTNLVNNINSKDQTIANLQVALRNEESKPPKEVIKEVQKIVIEYKEVIKEVPVYTHDAETKANVSKTLGLVQTIFDYFAGQFKTFQKYIKK